MENLKLLFQLYYRPAAMSDIIDRGSWVFALVAMLIVMLAFQFAVNLRIVQSYAVVADRLVEENFEAGADDAVIDGKDLRAREKTEAAAAGKTVYVPPASKPQFPLVGEKIFYFFTLEPLSFSPLVSLLLFFVPALLILARVLGSAGYAMTNARNNYMPLSTCVMMAWTAGHLPFALAGVLLSGAPADGFLFVLMWAASGLLFGSLAIFAVRTVLGANYGAALAVVILAAFAFPLGMYVFRYVSPYLFSPFLIIMVVLYFGGFLRSEARGFGNSFRQRQNFNRYLQSATINPRDADAHVQLALIYLQRRQEAKALEHLHKAFEIDPQEIDANYELGKIARREGEFQKALNHFGVVVEQNDRHKSSEVWREIGAIYMVAQMYSDALKALETYNARHPFDAEGLYYLGKTLQGLGEPEKAREAFGRAAEAAQNAPRYRRGEIAQWGKLAQKEL